MAKEKPYEFLDENTMVTCEATDCIHHEECRDKMLVRRGGHQICLWLSIWVDSSGLAAFTCRNYETKEKEE